MGDVFFMGRIFTFSDFVWKLGGNGRKKLGVCLSESFGDYIFRNHRIGSKVVHKNIKF